MKLASEWMTRSSVLRSGNAALRTHLAEAAAAVRASEWHTAHQAYEQLITVAKHLQHAADALWQKETEEQA